MRFAPAGLLHSGTLLVSHNIQENGAYLGAPLVVVPVCLAVASRRRPVTAVAGLLAVLSYALSLGTRIYHDTPAPGWPGPFPALAHVPVLQDIEPARLSLFTALFAAVVLGTGLDALARPRPAAAAAPAQARGPAPRARPPPAAAPGSA